MFKSKNLVLLELNELNFDAVQAYLDKGEELPNLRKLLTWCFRITSAESLHSSLEPWIQWPSVHTGLKFEQHRLFRLGDAVLRPHPQIFELVEAAGFRVGAISPMNAVNKLKNPAYFIPDPWTKTSSDHSLFSREISRALRQTVNDNSKGSISIRSGFALLLGFIWRVRLKSYPKMIRLALSSLRRPWRKAIFLDALLHEWHLSLLRAKRPNFSAIFLNAGAHIQHHYFLNTIDAVSGDLCNPSWYLDDAADPFVEVLRAYDSIVGDFLTKGDIELLVMTGLSQTPVERGVFYYRLRDHAQFLRLVGVPFESVSPRMTRDFLITCSSMADASEAERTLRSLKTKNGVPVFEEIDNRGRDIFVVLTYADQITKDTSIEWGDNCLDLKPHVVFVAVKNGEHCGRGYAFFSEGLQSSAPANGSHVAAVHNTLKAYFDLI